MVPAIYRLRCSSCLNAPQASGGVAAYVAMDGRKDGAVLPNGFMALQLDSDELVCVPHPAEMETLKQHGFTMSQAERQGRLFRVLFKICLGCGTLHEERQKMSGTRGCIVGMVLGPLSIPCFKFIAGWDWLPSILGGWFLLSIPQLATELFAKLRWRKLNARHAVRSCTRCGKTKFTTLADANRKQIMCGHCQKPTMKCEWAGVS
jgi:hypothetical protein